MRQARTDMNAYLGYALVATLGVVLLPTVVVLGIEAAADFAPPLLVSVAFGVGLSIALSVVGSLLWARDARSLDVGFGELMLWTWLRRRRTERRLRENARDLGLDEMGNRVAKPKISAAQQMQILRDLTLALETKDPYTRGHTSRVERHTYKTALAMKLSATEVEKARRAATVHDVGKIGVPNAILHKAGALNEDEWTVMKQHPVIGARLATGLEDPDIVAAIRHHHERWDGAGYPDGLSGAAIPLFARIVAVGDTFDAVTSTRSYRSSASASEAIALIRAESGSQFDPEVVDAFLKSLPRRVPLASMLWLAAPGDPIRRLSSWFRRLIGGASAPAIGAVGAAVVLGASTFIAAPGRDVAKADAPVAAAHEDEPAAEASEGDAADGSTRDRVLGRSPARRDVEARRGRTNRNEKEDGARDEGSRAARRDATAPASDGRGGDRSDPAGAPPDNGSREADENPAPDSEPQAPPDPQEDKGQDCSGNGQGQGRGEEIHCG